MAAHALMHRASVVMGFSVLESARVINWSQAINPFFAASHLFASSFGSNSAAWPRALSAQKELKSTFDIFYTGVVFFLTICCTYCAERAS